MADETETITALQDRLKIDRYALDECLQEQADLFNVVADEYALAVSNRDQANEELKQTDARLNEEVRRSLDNEGQKVTESLVSARIQNEPEHKQALDKYLSWKRYADELHALKDSFQQRSHMLRELVQLYVSGYFVASASATGKSDYEHHDLEELRQRMSKARAEAGFATSNAVSAVE